MARPLSRKCPRALQNAAAVAWRTLASLLLIGLIYLPAATPAAAQSMDPFGWFGNMFQPQQPRSYEPSYRPPPRRHHVAKPKPDHPVAEQRPTVPPSFFVAVLGDLLGQLLAQGLTEAMADRPEVAILHKAHESSGLVRDDFYDWPKAVQELLASGQKIDVAVVLIGSNDHQTLHEGGVSYEPGSAKWEEIYAQRVEAIATLFKNAKIPLLWVGLPIMKNERFSAEMASLNDIYREHAAKAGATFIDVWDGFSDENGRFTTYGPDVSGQVVRMRSSDGVHFTKAGARKLAQFAETEIRRILDASKPKDDAALAKIETTTPAGAITPNAAKDVPVKPAIGPVLPLTGPVMAPGGALATSAAAAGSPKTVATDLPCRAAMRRLLNPAAPMISPGPRRTDCPLGGKCFKPSSGYFEQRAGSDARTACPGLILYG